MDVRPPERFCFQKGGRALLPWTAFSNRGQESVPTAFLKNKTAEGEQGHPSQRLVFLITLTRPSATLSRNKYRVTHFKTNGRERENRMAIHYSPHPAFGHSLEASRDFAFQKK